MKKSLLLLALCCFTISNAQKYKKIKGNEKIVTQARTTNVYEKIEVGGSFDVKLISGKEGNIVIKGDENLLEYIKTEVKGSTLYVYFEKGINIQYDYNSSISITIPFEEINQLSFTGSGNFSNTDSINSENFNFTMSGSGNVKLETSTINLKITKSGSGNLNNKGKTTNLEINAAGSGNANAYDLVSDNVIANQSGSGNIKINCTGNLTASSSGSGSINYKGNPKKVNKQSAGSGSISGS